MAMPNSIVLADAESTPANHTFVPIQDGADTRLINGTGATILSGQETLAVEVIRPKTDAAQLTARVVLWDPVEGTVDGQTVVLRGSSGTASFKFPPGSTLQERKNVMKMLANACIDADIVAAVTNGIPLNA